MYNRYLRQHIFTVISGAVMYNNVSFDWITYIWGLLRKLFVLKVGGRRLYFTLWYPYCTNYWASSIGAIGAVYLWKKEKIMWFLVFWWGGEIAGCERNIQNWGIFWLTPGYFLQQSIRKGRLDFHHEVVRKARAPFWGLWSCCFLGQW